MSFYGSNLSYAVSDNYLAANISTLNLLDEVYR
uniref:Uncharacterized protein n=1 Tax=Arundo donax TaxID=35708 RepID=A0A0A9GM67_ARUDO